MSNINEIWNYPMDEIMRGYSESDTEYLCLLCGDTFKKGRVYSIDGSLYDAQGAIASHIAATHGSMADYLLIQTPTLTGVSDIQLQFIKLMYEKKTDREISEALGIALSTVRNHRFKLREKEKQAKLFLVLMSALAKKTNHNISTGDQGTIKEIHSSATMVDDRYNITEQEYRKTVKTYMDETGALRQFPSKEKKKLVLLTEIAKNFKRDVKYSEKEVNRILKRIYAEDYPSIRRALIEYGFMDRSNDCKVYRVKE